MTDDHHDWTAKRATPLVTGADEILGTHRAFPADLNISVRAVREIPADLNRIDASLVVAGGNPLSSRGDV
jgi:hypothetical protein